MNILYVGPGDELYSQILRELARCHANVHIESEPTDALDRLRVSAPDCVVCALDEATAAFLQRVAHAMPDTFRVAVLRTTDAADLMDIVNRGRVGHLITAAAPAAGVTSTIAAMTAHQRSLGVNRSALQNATDWAKCLETRIADANETADQALEDVLIALVTALDMRENESANHSRRVALYSLFLASHLDVDSSQYEWIFRGALLHDVGKIGVRDEVLLKPGALTSEERRHMEQHVPIGVRVLSQVGMLRPAMAIPQYHHEHYDGTGYPKGIVGRDIPLPARIVAVAEAFDILTSAQHRNEADRIAAAMNNVIERKGTEFDPVCVEALLTQVDKVAEITTTYADPA